MYVHPMSEKISLKEALKNQGITYEHLIQVIGKTRQTISGYIRQYEKDGTVNNAKAQAEFDRIIAEERSRILALTSTDAELERIRSEIDSCTDRSNAAKEEMNRLLLELICSHPEIEIHDTSGHRITGESEDDIKKISRTDMDRLIESLTDEEQTRWCLAVTSSTRAILETCTNTRTERVLMLEKLWDSTSDGKPNVYEENIEVMIEDGPGYTKEVFRASSICLSDGRSADIYADQNLPIMGEYEVSAEISVICAGRIQIVARIRMGEINGCEGYKGHVEGLFPNYKYLYSIDIKGQFSDYDPNPRNWKPIASCKTREHPLK